MVVAGDERQPCGVKDYARHLAAEMADESSRVVEILPPCYGVHRINIKKLRTLRNRVIRQTHAIPPVSLVHAQYSDYSWNGTRLYEDLYEVFVRKCRSPFVVTIHEHPWFRNEHELDRPKTWADFVFSWLAGYRVVPKSFPLELFSRHIGIHVHHAWQKQVLVSNGVPESKIRVIPISIPECVATPDQEAAFRQRFGFKNKRMIVIAGFVLERKRYDRILELLPGLLPDIVLCALGGSQGPASEKYIADLIERARVLGVSDRFVVSGYLSEPELNAGLLAADVFVAPYGEVTSSASVARCIGAVAPIMAGKCSSFEELEVGGAGLVVVDMENKAEMKRVLLGLLEKNEQYCALRQKNLEYAAKLTLSNVASALQVWYRECLGKCDFCLKSPATREPSAPATDSCKLKTIRDNQSEPT